MMDDIESPNTYQQIIEVALQKGLDRLVYLQQGLAVETDPEKIWRIDSEITAQRKENDVLQRNLESLKTAEQAVAKVESLGGNISGSLGKLVEVGEKGSRIEEIEKQLEDLVTTSKETIEKLKGQALYKAIEPKLSILRPNVRLIDANLAYKYADYQSDVNILSGFTTMFLGTGLASLVSLVISVVVGNQNQEVAIYGTSLSFCFVVSVILGILTLRANKKAKDAKRQFEIETATGGSEVVNLREERA